MSNTVKLTVSTQIVEKKNRSEYMRNYHKEKQRNDEHYREKKNNNAKKYYAKKLMTEDEIAFRELVKKKQSYYQDVVLPLAKSGYWFQHPELCK